MVSAITAAKHTDEIAGVMLASPAFSLVDDAKELFGSADAVPETYFHMIMTVGALILLTCLAMMFMKQSRTTIKMF